MTFDWKPTTFFCIILIAITISCLFAVKHRVHVISKEMSKLNANIVREKEAIHILHAEWAFLTQPGKIAKLTDKHLHLQPMSSKDIKRFSINTSQEKKSSSSAPLILGGVE